MIDTRRAAASAAAGLIAVSTAAVVLSTAPSPAAPGQASARAGLATVHVFVTKGRMVHMRSPLRPGVHKFVIRSGGTSAFQILRTRNGYNDTKLEHDINAGVNGGDVTSFKRFERNVVLLGGVSSKPGQRAVMFANLAPGARYIAVDTNAQSNLAAKFHHFTVAGSRVAGSMPRVSTLRAIHEMTWAGRPRHIAHSGLLAFANRATDNHFIALAKLMPGKTMKDWRRFVNKVKAGQNPGPPPVNFNVGLDTGVVSPGHRMVLRYHLPRGRYVLTCFWPDVDEGGLPHAFLGMYRKIVLR